MGQLNLYIDHTCLKPEAPEEKIRQTCREAKEHQFASVCLHPWWVETAARELADTSVKVCTVIGFPLGATYSEIKAKEVQLAHAKGAREFDMVLNVSALKSGDLDSVREDIQSVVKASNGETVKVILETCLLTSEEIVKACQAAEGAGAHFVKTSTGFSKSGATLEAVKLMKQTVGNRLKVKASGGIRDRETAEKFIRAGAERLGTSSGVAIIQGENTGLENY